MKKNRTPQLVISCHADTGFRTHRLVFTNGNFVGHLDNFAGVHAVMTAYFSGRMNSNHLRIELTYGEETDMEGAYEVRRSLSSADMVVVVDVTGTETEYNITIEKCRSPRLQRFINTALAGLSYALYEGCPDPIADEDECDVYGEKLQNVFYLGIPCAGEDYNAGVVSCREESIRTASEALIRLSERFTQDMELIYNIIDALRNLRNQVEYAPGHQHLYEEFDEVLRNLVRYRDAGGLLTPTLAREMLATIDLLLQENMVGRRPWTGNWETYFAKCMDDAYQLVQVFASFADSATFRPPGYCNRFLGAFAHMDRHDREYEERQPRWSKHFANLAIKAAEMFALLADSAAMVKADFLEHPDDRVFTWLLSGYAKADAPEAITLLREYLSDDEAWVQRLAERLLQECMKAQQRAQPTRKKPREAER